MMTLRARPDRGQAVPLLLAVVAVAAVVLFALASLAAAAVDGARARAAADAVALAESASGRSTAQAVATANHARIVSVSHVGDDVLVVVVVGRAHATARARTYVAEDRPAP